MLKLDFTTDVIFGFNGPNLCFLGKEHDFKKLAEIILPLTSPNLSTSIEITSLDFIEPVGDKTKVFFNSKSEGNSLGILNEEQMIIVFELDSRVWERIFKYLVLMSWSKATYYLNSFEDCLRDLPLIQECHLICSSSF